MAVQMQDDRHEHTFSNYVRIRHFVRKTCLKRWTIRKSGERGSGISVLPARHDDDDDDIIEPRSPEPLANTLPRREPSGRPWLRSPTLLTYPCGSNKWFSSSSEWAPMFDMKHLRKAERHIGRNVVSITMKIRSIVWIFLFIKLARYICLDLFTSFWVSYLNTQTQKYLFRTLIIDKLPFPFLSFRCP